MLGALLKEPLFGSNICYLCIDYSVIHDLFQWRHFCFLMQIRLIAAAVEVSMASVAGAVDYMT